MPLYETVFIARQDLAPSDVDELTDKLAKIITDRNGKIVSKEYWGLRNLSYKINKNSRGHYVLLNIDADYDAVAELKRVISYNENVIRNVTYTVESHVSESNLFASKTAKDFKANFQRKPTETDLMLDQIQFDS